LLPLKPRPDVVSALSELLRAVVTKDMAAIVRALSPKAGEIAVGTRAASVLHNYHI
jgi:hypothetical protein